MLRRYLRTGLPLVALAFLDQSLVSVDQLIVLAYFSLRELGLYNVAIIASEAIRTLGLAGGAVLGPRLLRRYASAGGKVTAIQSLTLLPVRLYAQLLPLPIGMLWVAGSYGLARVYPSYVEALRPMQILLIAVNFLVVLGGVTTFLFAIDKHPRTLLFLAPALCLNVAIDIALIRGGWGLTGVATGSLVTYFLYAFAQLWYICGHFGLGLRQRLRFQVGAFGPGVCLGIVLSAIEWSVPYRASLAGAASACALTGTLLLPFAWRALRVAARIDEGPEPVS
jgi:O-antigen/teichoic acid export membrane protein